MKIKKIIALAMTGALSLSLLTGCGSGKSNHQSGADSGSSASSDVGSSAAKDSSDKGGSGKDDVKGKSVGCKECKTDLVKGKRCKRL